MVCTLLTHVTVVPSIPITIVKAMGYGPCNHYRHLYSSPLSPTKLERMELEVRDAEAGQREKLRSRILSYQVELKRLEGEFSRVRMVGSEG